VRYTNKLGLPDPIYRAITETEHTSGGADYSVTELLSPPRMSLLERLHDVSEDIADTAATELGTALHERYARYGDDDWLMEFRLYAEIDGVTISGTADMYQRSTGRLVDLKTSGVFGFTKGSDEYTKQVNIYAFLLQENGFEVNSAELVYALKDQSPRQRTFKGGDYPEHGFGIKPVELWDRADVLALLKERIELHKTATTATQCTDEERWIEDKWAAVKPESTRATKLFDNPTEAYAFAEDKDLEVEYRPGEPTRCLWYCRVAQVCEQFQEGS
jgi:hypothetical protein